MVFAVFLIIVLTVVAALGGSGLHRLWRNDLDQIGDRSAVTPTMSPLIELMDGSDPSQDASISQPPAPAPDDPESSLAARLLAGDLTADNYRQAMAALAAEEARRHPMTIPWDR